MIFAAVGVMIRITAYVKTDRTEMVGSGGLAKLWFG